MSLSEKVTQLLNGTIHSVHHVIPIPLNISSPTLYTKPFYQQSIGVLIGITGDIFGRILITGEEEIFLKISEKLYGIALQKEMIESFAGELGNMVVGNLCTSISQHGLTIDITPPTTFVGKSKVFGFEKALCLPVTIDSIGGMDIILLLEAL